MTEALHELNFRLNPLDSLDSLALRLNASRGDIRSWFGTFREARTGVFGRLYGTNILYREIHAWLPFRRMPVDIEYRLTSLFFNMDSALECFVFMLNAFGFGVSGAGFRDVGDEHQIRQVRVEDIIGSERYPVLDGYGEVFPRIQSQWVDHRDSIDIVRMQHDASKHRYAIFKGGKCNTDPPKGFFEKLGVAEDAAERAGFWPMEGVLLSKNPKLPVEQRWGQENTEGLYLEDMVERFVQLVNDSATFAYRDAEDFVKKQGLLA